ncbi:sigma-70 family RNA polymerase sigma factor, partial [Candidatus Gottesmanbacteria bacterium]|nr:sigma-70 family RNA polymerase sigma factor [Candidatus Gottesmanbacteria bacterium]
CQQKEIKREVEKVFASLSEGYRQILRLKYIEGFTVAQIGKILRLSFKSTESRLFRARLAFQKSWNENYLKSPFGFSSFLASKRGI